MSGHSFLQKYADCLHWLLANIISTNFELLEFGQFNKFLK
jgi:hypothetical protein